MLLTQCLSTTLILVNFELNRDLITDLFCINKNQPELHCDGNCYLKKQIVAEEESHSDKPQTRVEFVNLIFTLSQAAVLFQSQFSTPIKHSCNYVMPHYSNAIFTIFHPPKPW